MEIELSFNVLSNIELEALKQCLSYSAEWIKALTGSEVSGGKITFSCPIEMVERE